ncbi:DUF4328 domain-containing protein [Novosphingobium sp. PS1R-30]|uniref:DUF4328 domain-containing protein n=1 Tax=Novosphingobium anseongense TaxID=3133436 RepID=A0ABU8RR83_9SPHN
MTLLSLPEGLNLLDRRTRFARLALLAYLFASAFYLALLFAEFVGTIDLESPEPSVMAVVGLISLAYVIAFIAAMVFVALWIYRAHANLRAAEIDGLAFTPGWAVGWFFIPFANFVQPFKAMRELWAASRGEPDSYGSETDPRLKAWWGAWIVGNLLSYVATRYTESDKAVAMSVGQALDIAAIAILMGAA